VISGNNDSAGETENEEQVRQKEIQKPREETMSKTESICQIQQTLMSVDTG
jgi:hypothetical protein